MADRDLEKFLQLLFTFEHQKAMALFDKLIPDEANFWPIADALLLVCANHQDLKLTVPHGLQTVEAAREMFEVAGPEASRGLLRFIALYSFSLIKRDWTATYLQQQAGVVAGGPKTAFWTAVSSGPPDPGAAPSCAIATEKGLAAAAPSPPPANLPVLRPPPPH